MIPKGTPCEMADSKLSGHVDHGFNADHALDRFMEMLIIKYEEQRTNGCSSVSS